MNMEEIKDVLADEDVQKILKAAYRVPKNPVEISETYGIPIAKTYRKIKVLEDVGLLKKAYVKKDWKGKRSVYYKTSWDDVYVTYNGGSLKIRFETLMDMSSALRQRILTP